MTGQWLILSKLNGNYGYSEDQCISKTEQVDIENKAAGIINKAGKYVVTSIFRYYRGLIMSHPKYSKGELTSKN